MIWVGRRQIACKLVTINVGRNCITSSDLLDWKIHMKRVYLTYDNLAKQDGVGAQLQRILGIFSICRKWRLRYVHSNIIGTVEELSHNLNSANELDKLLEDVNDTFTLPSQKLPAKYRIIHVYNISLRKLARLIFDAYRNREYILVKICLPYGLIEKFPDWYEIAGDEIRKLKPYISLKPKNQVVVHIRYGYKPIEGSNSASSPRFLPLSYYPLALAQLFIKEKLDPLIPVIVHTDIPKSNGSWAPYQGTKIAELESIGYEFAENKLQYETVDLEADYFSDYANLTVKYSEPILETLEEMYTSKYLLMSRSSFSYIAGIINPNKVYIPRQHGHVKLTRWSWDFPEAETPKIELLSGI